MYHYIMPSYVLLSLELGSPTRREKLKRNLIFQKSTDVNAIGPGSLMHDTVDFLGTENIT